MSSDHCPHPRLTGMKLAITALALALGTFMQVLDTTIANVSLTTIAGNLGVSADTGTWVITAFAVANGVGVPLTGWLMQRFGVVRTFVGSVLLFTAASFLCGIAWNLTSLIVFRVLQGAVSGPLIPGSQALLIMVFPTERRAAALGIWSMTTLVGPIIGPILGGYISDNYHWGWIFLINIPFGLIAGAICWFNLKDRETEVKKLPIDVTGLLLLIFWVGALQIALDLGKNADWFNSSSITILLVLAAVGFVVWAIWELTDEHPIVDLSLFKHRNFVLGTVPICVGYALMFATILLLPMWLQQQLGYTATWAGLVSAPSGVVAVILTPVIARLSAKIDARLIASFCLAALAASFLMRSAYTSSIDYYHLMVPLMVQGVGISGFFISLVAISIDGIPERRLPAATGLNNFARIIAGSFAASIATTVWDRREALHQARLADAPNPFSVPFAQVAGRLSGHGLSELQTAALVTRRMIGEAYLLAVDDIFWWCGWATIALILLVWMARRPAPATGPIAAD